MEFRSICFWWIVLLLSRDFTAASARSLLQAVPVASTLALACRGTRNPGLCSSTLVGDPRSTSSNSAELTRIAIELGLNGARRDLNSVRQMRATTALDLNATSAADVCAESLDYAVPTLAAARDSLLVRPIEDTQAWVSAALQFQYDCFSGLSNVAPAPPVLAATVLPLVASTMELISIALSMTDALAFFGLDPTLWVPPSETRPPDIAPLLRAPIPVGASTREPCPSGSPPNPAAPNAVVALDGTGTFTSIQQAVDAAPANSPAMYVIRIKAGVYNERVRVHFNRTRIMLVGDGAEGTIITGSKSAMEPGVATYQTATVTVVGKGFVARGITFQNTAGSESMQAVGIRVDSDLAAFYECTFDGFQDTLYAHAGRHFYKSCTIKGTVDFIFGNSASVFQDCTILFKPRLVPGNPTYVITAQGRTDPGQITGFLFQNCSFSGTPEFLRALVATPAFYNGYLGRPWKLFSRTIVLGSSMDAAIRPAGWLPWNGTFALSSLLYGELGSSGPGPGLGWGPGSLGRTS